MAFRDFSYPSVLGKLGLTEQQTDLSGAATLFPVRAEFAALVEEGLAIAVGDLGVCTEKAKSEFIIAPLLIELRRALRRRFSVFSGMELIVHKGRGLNGSCDYILTKGSNQHLRDAPILGILEAKNEDYSSQGMASASPLCTPRLSKSEVRVARDPVFGAVTTGRTWQFLQLCHID